MLKRRTTSARRLARGSRNLQARRIAEKLVVNSLKTGILLGELPKDYHNDGRRQDQLQINCSLHQADGVFQKKPLRGMPTDGSLRQYCANNRLRAVADQARRDILDPTECTDDEKKLDDMTRGHGKYDILIPETGGVRSDVLSTLPPSAQMDVMLKIREQSTMENRTRFQDVSEKTEEFSKLQISSYLKSSNLRQKIVAVTASANREYLSTTPRVALEESVGLGAENTNPTKKRCIASTIRREYFLSEPDKIDAKLNVPLVQVCEQRNSNLCPGLEKETDLSEWKQYCKTQHEGRNVARAIQPCEVHRGILQLSTTEISLPDAKIPRVIAKVPALYDQQLAADEDHASFDFIFEAADAASWGIDPLFEGKSMTAHEKMQKVFPNTVADASENRGNVADRSTCMIPNETLQNQNEKCRTRVQEKSEMYFEGIPKWHAPREDLKGVPFLEVTEGQQKSRGGQSQNVIGGYQCSRSERAFHAATCLHKVARDIGSVIEVKSKNMNNTLRKFAERSTCTTHTAKPLLPTEPKDDSVLDVTADEPQVCVTLKARVTDDAVVGEFDLTGQRGHAATCSHKKILLSTAAPQDEFTVQSHIRKNVKEHGSNNLPETMRLNEAPHIWKARVDEKSEIEKLAMQMPSGKEWRSSIASGSQPIPIEFSDDVFEISADIPVPGAIFFPDEEKAIDFSSLDIFKVEATRALDRVPSHLSRGVVRDEGVVVECRGFRFDLSVSTLNSLPAVINSCHNVIRLYPNLFKMTRNLHDERRHVQQHTAGTESLKTSHNCLVNMLIGEAKKEKTELQNEKQGAKRGADAPTQDMYRQIQELLSIFGMPYIIAPQEAEAQCAWLNSEGIVDAVITDDNDAFLFGAKTVYRHVFESKKYVEVHSADRIQVHLGLDRRKLAELALLLGSDYTEGISGVGIVNALEIVTAFPGLDGLRVFRNWAESQDFPDCVVSNQDSGESAFQKMKGTSTSVEKHTKLVGINKIHSCSVDGNGPIEYAEIASRRDSFMRGHDAMKRNWWIPDDFPSSAVLEAYETPAVDRSKECPKWGKPNVDLLRAFCYDNFHWQHTQTDELIQPVLTFWKTFDRRSHIGDFFSNSDNDIAFTRQFAKYRSARIQSSIADLTRKSRN